MDRKPKSKEEIFEELEQYQEKDMKYSDGRILGSMCTEAEPIAKEVFYKFINSNLGDPGLFPGTKAIEDKAIKMIGSLVSIDDPYGHIVTGGTEANLMAMRAARNYARRYKNITEPEMIVPKSAHFSFKKAADMFGMKLVEADMDGYLIDVNSLENKINKNTAVIVAIAGTTELGLIDNVEEIAEIAKKHDIYLHVDAAFGGFVIPFLKEEGYDFPKFDFSLDAVCSMTIDPHKMGLSVIPSGCILFRDKKYLDVMAVKAPYLTKKEQSTIVGTRSGASSAATLAVMESLGREGYRKLALDVMDKTMMLKEGLEDIGYDLVVEPQLNIVAFYHKDIDTDYLADLLEQRGWRVSTSFYPKAIRVIVMKHISRDNIRDLLVDLKAISYNI
ncbi:tyrosine decarboxylase MfnA [Methanobrevibacter boviskoreani]|uniref:tyrosine decarboxylase MfnA n=1 Tax=Methanobrevibacter boviskoreani TaxID=1348249 RepID=UPI0023A792DA|nr:tyrosine decarboxylase MfnA [Methanobrevibacter boviskoreani]MCI6774148.1 tyrosine decarboxylase MfnA [Methanobrevibacter boviskoreani]MDD6256764.1 tyrosine decarboxylase MfnA [Methanobrevibacter boviskoreani]MDY5615141.1 tyrosine decarboxylase MfnA [Methanobrevibacter boviskoreani]